MRLQSPRLPRDVQLAVMTEWNIQSRAHACAACGKSFADQEPYHTLLFDEKADFRRSDICEACWQKQYSDGARERKGFISYWQGVYEAPPPPTDAIKKETAESLLRKLIELNDPRYIPAGYILAVMLERKRMLKVKEQLVRDGQRFSSTNSRDRRRVHHHRPAPRSSISSNKFSATSPACSNTV